MKVLIFLLVIFLWTKYVSSRYLKNKGTSSRSGSTFSLDDVDDFAAAMAPPTTTITAAVYTSKRKSAPPWNRKFTVHHEDGRISLNYYGLMLAGAIARATASTAVHPLNVMKTMLQLGKNMPERRWSTLMRGAGSQFILSMPHGALNFAVTETTKAGLAHATRNSSLIARVPTHILNPCLDFTSSAISTLLCSIVSTPQMVGCMYPYLF